MAPQCEHVFVDSVTIPRLRRTTVVRVRDHFGLNNGVDLAGGHRPTGSCSKTIMDPTAVKGDVLSTKARRLRSLQNAVDWWAESRRNWDGNICLSPLGE